jgi:hypothetical protein
MHMHSMAFIFILRTLPAPAFGLIAVVDSESAASGCPAFVPLEHDQFLRRRRSVAPDPPNI